MRLTVNSDTSMSEAIGVLREAYKEHKYLTVTLNTGKKRSISQNSLSHQWYAQVAIETQEYTAGHVKCLCKYHVGLPILRGVPEDERSTEIQKICTFCEEVLDHVPYETRIEMMEYLPVTSLMTTEQLSEYLTGVQFNYSRKNVILYWPDEWVKNGEKYVV